MQLGAVAELCPLTACPPGIRSPGSLANLPLLTHRLPTHPPTCPPCCLPATLLPTVSIMEGGIEGIFTPMHMLVFQKPDNAKSTKGSPTKSPAKPAKKQ
jgi:hypothetical protein